MKVRFIDWTGGLVEVMGVMLISPCVQAERALRGFIISFFVFTTVAAAAAAERHVEVRAKKTCGWRCSIQKQIEMIQQQLNWITEQLVST
jgi:hypothetical protein